MWNQLLPDLTAFYTNCRLINQFNANDLQYLDAAFHDIDTIWNKNFTKIEKVKYIMLSEAPLWGNLGKYIYNPIITNCSSFFWCSVLLYALNQKGLIPTTNLKTNADLVDELNNLGFLIVDVSPYALNTVNTSMNYPQLSHRQGNNYFNLIDPTLSVFFDDKLKKIIPKIPEEGVKIFYRYKRVENCLGNSINTRLSIYSLSILPPPLNNISLQGGSIDKNKLAKII